jgi:hypothetical protein
MGKLNFSETEHSPDNFSSAAHPETERPMTYFQLLSNDLSA